MPSLKTRASKITSGIVLLLLMCIFTAIWVERNVRTDSGENAPVRATIYELDEYLILYRITHGKCPSTTDGLHALLIDHPTLKADIFVDIWGAKVAYVVSEDRLSCRTYSFGKNGVDEKMRGDDIFTPVQ